MYFRRSRSTTNRSIDRVSELSLSQDLRAIAPAFRHFHPMIPSDVESQLLSLSTPEKTQIIQMLLQSISDIWTGIDNNEA